MLFRLLLLCAVLLVPAVALAEDVSVPRAAAETAAARKAGDRIRPQGVTPLVSELLRIVEAERATLDELRATAMQTADPAGRLEIQRRIESVKRETQLTLLRVQADYARREGRLEVAGQLEAALLRMQGGPATAPIAPRTQAEQ